MKNLFKKPIIFVAAITVMLFSLVILMGTTTYSIKVTAGPCPLVEICDNQIDDNCDGYTDCDDEGCLQHPFCQDPVCGNNTIESGEECDDGQNNGNVCTPPYDDSCEYCSETCVYETVEGGYCGDEALDEQYEECDGDEPEPCETNEGYEGERDCDEEECFWDECESDEYCGDGIQNGPEDCDDGNNDDGDGCSAICEEEHECITDAPCDYLDDDYCLDTLIMHDEGVCVNYECTVDTTPVTDCDDGLYCNGQETCSNANFRLKATVTDVSGSFYVNHIRVKVYYTESGSASPSVGIPGDTGWKNPTATGDDYNEWTNPTYAYFSDEDRVELSSSGLKQDYYDFDFNIPSGATIDGILVEIEGYEDIVGELGIKLSWNGGANTTSTKYVLFTTSEGYVSVGGDTDTWGRTWSDSHFSDANCVGGTAVDCSTYNLNSIETCGFDPDNNIFTWDFFEGFLSECDEETDSCALGTVELEHSCDIESCDAECEEDEDCEEGGYCNSLCACEYEEEPYCGDGILETYEQCEEGYPCQEGYTCSSGCLCEEIITRSYCGDGTVDEGEDCDDGNNIDEGCSPPCESSCSYCSAACALVTLTGGSCGGGGGGGSTPNPPKRPTLIIDKSIAEEFANPGSLITYTIVVTNTGPGIAYNATLDDDLPSVFSYNDLATTGEWDLGDLKKGDSETITFLARVGDGVAAGTYSSPAETEADNHNPVSDDAGIEIRIPAVLGEMTELPDTNGITSLMTLLWIVALVALMYSGTTLAEIFTGIRV